MKHLGGGGGRAIEVWEPLHYGVIVACATTGNSFLCFICTD
jgi:hypothetical protein